MGFRSANHFGVEKILAILSRTNSTDITKNLRKVLLSCEATGHSHVQPVAVAEAAYSSRDLPASGGGAIISHERARLSKG